MLARWGEIPAAQANFDVHEEGEEEGEDLDQFSDGDDDDDDESEEEKNLSGSDLEDEVDGL